MTFTDIETFNQYRRHVGHHIEIAMYGDGQCVAIECMDCCEIIEDADLSV